MTPSSSSASTKRAEPFSAIAASPPSLLPCDRRSRHPKSNGFFTRQGNEGTKVTASDRREAKRRKEVTRLSSGKREGGGWS